MDDTLCILSFVGFLSFLFPIFLNLNAFVDGKEKKGCFGIYLFRFFKIYGGYATLYKEGIAFHLTKKKAVLLPYKELGNTRKKFEITDGFQVYSYHQIVEIGNRENVGGAVLAAAFIESLAGALFARFFAEKKYLSLKSGVMLTPESDTLKVSVSMTAIFNLLVLSMASTKILLEKVIEYERKRKKQKSRRNGGNLPS